MDVDKQASEIESERERRLSFWSEVSDGGRATGLLPAFLRERGIYGGAAGTWVDKTRTRTVSGDLDGVTVSVLHNGFSYDDDLSDDCLLYHYPDTDRIGSTDASEIRATKNVQKLGLPLFVITHPYRKARTRDLRLGWVEDWDDASKIFLIQFGETAPSAEREHAKPKPFRLKTKRRKTTSTSQRDTRAGQQKFKFECLQRYGPECAVCGISIPEALDAAHLCGVEENGSDDARNGLILCAVHHRLLDADMFGIDPKSLDIHLAPDLGTASALKISRKSISHLKNKPHNDALKWIWNRFTSRHGT